MKKIADIKYGENNLQVLDIFLPDTDKFSVFIYFHGGGLESGDRKMKFYPELVEKGIAVVSADYRMYPDAVFPEFIEDAASVVAWVMQNMDKYGEMTEIFVGGSSAGGYLSQMLCFDKKYLEKHQINVLDIDGFYHDAGQPTTHFNVLRERGIDTRKVIVDEAAPLFHIDDSYTYPPMEIVVSDNDMKNRYEQTMLLMSTLEHFGHDMSKVFLSVQKNSKHCEYLSKRKENGSLVFGDMVYEFISKVLEMKK